MHRNRRRERVTPPVADGRSQKSGGAQIARRLTKFSLTRRIPMGNGTVESIHIASAAKAPMRAVDQIEAIPGVGLEGDRYALKQGTFFKPEPDFELTLIEAEAIEAIRREYQIEVAPVESRRNLVTRGVPLNHLVGKDFL